MSNVDIGPTILDLAGVPPTEPGMQGRSLASVLKGNASAWTRTHALVEWISDHDDVPAFVASHRFMIDTPNNTCMLPMSECLSVPPLCS